MLDLKKSRLALKNHRDGMSLCVKATFTLELRDAPGAGERPLGT